MICKNCGANIPENEIKCPNCGIENIDETEYISAAAPERVIPKGFSAKKNIVVIIIIAAALLIGGIVTAVTVSNSAAGNISASETLQLAERYLSEQNYEQAVIEFQKVLEIEPMNVEAYLGLAEAYLSLGETDKAIELLENGFEQTDSSSLKDKLEKIRENTETSAETVTVEEAISEIAATETEETAYETTEPVTILGEELDIATTPVVRITPNDNPILNSDGTITASVILELTNGKYKGSDTFILEWCGNNEWNILGAYLNYEGAEFANPDDAADFTFKINEGAEKVVFYSTYPSLKNAVSEPPAYGSMGSVTILGQEFDIATTVEVNLRKKGITDEILKEIEPEIKKLTNLTRLDLGDNQITDITPIAELINLTDLTLAWNQITDVTPIAKLTNLKYLLMNEIPITDITPLAGLTNLTYLESQGNDTIIDISPLAKLTNLTDLILNGNQITDISSLAGLTNLRNLGLTSNEITNITPLEGLTNLTLLQLWSNPISEQDIKDLQEKLPSCSIE